MDKNATSRAMTLMDLQDIYDLKFTEPLTI